MSASNFIIKIIDRLVLIENQGTITYTSKIMGKMTTHSGDIIPPNKCQGCDRVFSLFTSFNDEKNGYTILCGNVDPNKILQRIIITGTTNHPSYCGLCPQSDGIINSSYQTHFTNSFCPGNFRGS